MPRTIVLLLCLATLGILCATANAQCGWYRYRCVPQYSVRYQCTPVTVVYSSGYRGCCTGHYYAYPDCGYGYYGSSCCLPTQPWPATSPKSTTSQKPTLPKPPASDVEAKPAPQEKEPPKEEASSVLEKPKAKKKPTNGNAPAVDLPTPPAPEPISRDILPTIKGDVRFATLLEVATQAGLAQELDTPGPFTIFAPTNEAFAKLDPEFLERLLAAPESLQKVLQYHALTERLSIDDAIKQGKLPTLTGLEVQIQEDGDQVLVDKAKVIERDVNCRNGVVHVIDAVLIPPGFEIPPADSEEKPTTTPPVPAPVEKKPVAPTSE